MALSLGILDPLSFIRGISVQTKRLTTIEHESMKTHHLFIIEHLPIEGSHRRCSPRKIAEHDKSLPFLTGPLLSDNIDDLSVRREEIE